MKYQEMKSKIQITFMELLTNNPTKLTTTKLLILPSYFKNSSSVGQTNNIMNYMYIVWKCKNGKPF